MLRAAIFDMDGVIVDTVPLHFEAWKRMFAEHGVDFTFDDYKQKVDGIPRTDGARNMLPDLSSDELKKATDRKQSYFLEFLASKDIPVYKTTTSLMDQFHANDVKVAAISSSKNCVSILTKIGLMDRLDAVVDGHAITRGKPDPQIFLMAAGRLGAEPRDSVVFEDAVLGVEAARNAGMKCVGIDRYNEPDRLRLADLIVTDAGEVDVRRIRALF